MAFFVYLVGSPEVTPDLHHITRHHYQRFEYSLPSHCDVARHRGHMSHDIVGNSRLSSRSGSPKGRRPHRFAASSAADPILRDRGRYHSVPSDLSRSTLWSARIAELKHSRATSSATRVDLRSRRGVPPAALSIVPGRGSAGSAEKPWGQLAIPFLFEHPALRRRHLTPPVHRPRSSRSFALFRCYLLTWSGSQRARRGWTRRKYASSSPATSMSAGG